MFNFYDEIKKELVDKVDLIATGYNIVNINGQILYVEGQCGLVTLSPNQIIFKLKKARAIIDGQGMRLYELTNDTLKIAGKITSVEVI